MQFIIIAYDGTDAKAEERRLKVRPLHLERMKELRATGNFVCGGAILDMAGKMSGSMLICEFPDMEDVEEYLKTEPYVAGGVWQDIEVKPFRMATIE